MWFEEPEDIKDYFSRIEREEGKEPDELISEYLSNSNTPIPEENILGESYFVISENILNNWLKQYEEIGIDTSRLDTSDQNGSAYPKTFGEKGLIVVDHERAEQEVRATAIHEEAHIATGSSCADRFNVEGVAYARENFYREQAGLEHFEIDYYPLLTRIVDQWTNSYINAAEEIGDKNTLQLASETLNEHEPSPLQKIKTPLTNSYIETFDEKVADY